MHSPFLGELLGTMVLIIFGDGVVAGVLLKDSKAEGAGWMAITTAWGLAVMSGIFVAIATGSKDAHLNPAVTIAFAIVSGDYSKMAIYIPAQLIGGFLGAVVVWLHYLPHWRATPDPDLKLAVFCTGPGIRDLKANWLSEVIGTIVLIVVVASIASKAVGAPVPLQPGFAPYLVGMLVWVIGLGARGHHRLRDQPRARLRPAPCARRAADPRQGPFRLGLRADPDPRPDLRRGGRRRHRPRAGHLSANRVLRDAGERDRLKRGGPTLASNDEAAAAPLHHATHGSPSPASRREDICTKSFRPKLPRTTRPAPCSGPATSRRSHRGCRRGP